MKSPQWTQAELKLLRENYAEKNKSEMLTLLPNRTGAGIRTVAKKLGLKKVNWRHIFTEEEKEYLRKNYANTSSHELAKTIGCKICSIYNIAHVVGLKKSIDFLSGEQKKRQKEHPEKYATGWIKKGNVPPNKGKKMSEETRAKIIATGTNFKKGNLPHNTRPDGSERVDEHYIMFKPPGSRRFVLKHRWIWEQAHGKLQKGQNIQFIDGNPQNCVLENLYLITRSEQIRQNTIQNYPTEIKTAMRRIGTINKLIKKQML